MSELRSPLSTWKRMRISVSRSWQKLSGRRGQSWAWRTQQSRRRKLKRASERLDVRRTLCVIVAGLCLHMHTIVPSLASAQQSLLKRQVPSCLNKYPYVTPVCVSQCLGNFDRFAEFASFLSFT